MNKISLVLSATLVSVPVFAQVNQPMNPQVNATAACDMFNQLEAGMPLSQIEDMLAGQSVPMMQIGKTYQWSYDSGYKYSLNFLENGAPVGFADTGPVRIVYIPPLRTVDYPYPYGIQSVSEKRAIYLAHKKKINYSKAVQLLGAQNDVIGYVYALNWPTGKTVTLATNLNDTLTDFSVNAYCGNVWHKDDIRYFI